MERLEQWRTLLADYSPRIFSPCAIDNLARGEEAVERIRRSAADGGLERFLDEARSDGAPLLVIANDTHRPTDSRSAIEAVCRVADAVDPRMQFRLLIATGSHVFKDKAEIRKHEEWMLGNRGERFVARAWHDSTDTSSVAPLSVDGDKSVCLHSWLFESKSALAIGSMEPHYFAGATGAFKTFSVGCMRFEDIARNHRGALAFEATGLRLDGNPIFDGLAAVVKSLGQGRRLFAINEVLAGGGVAGCYCGDPLDTQRAALPMLRDTFGGAVDAPMDLIVSIVEPPLERDLYQADKGIKNIEGAVRDGGTIILDASCNHGVGIDRFHRMLRRTSTSREILELIQKEGYALGDHKAARLRTLTDDRGIRIGVIAEGLSAGDAEIAGMKLFRSREDSMSWVLSYISDRAGAAIVNDSGNFTLTVYK